NVAPQPMLRGVIAHDGGVGNVTAATSLEAPFDRGPPTAILENRVEGPKGLPGGAAMLRILAGAHELVQVARGDIDGVARQALAAPGIGILVSLDRLTGFELNRCVQAFDWIGGGRAQHRNERT